MVYLKKTWVRIILSIFIGGIVNELLRISSGQPNSAPSNKDSFVTFAVALIVFVLLNQWIKKRNQY